MNSALDMVLLYPHHKVKVKYCQSISSILSFLKQHGFNVVEITGSNNYQIYQNIRDLNPRFIGISVPFTYLAPSAHELINLIHQHTSIPVVVGGVHVQLCPDEFVDADFVCLGDGEQYLLQLLSGEQPSCKQLSLDILPLPEYTTNDLIPLPNGVSAMPYQTSRGCPFNCGFCSNGMLSQQQVRLRSISRIKEDIMFYKQQGINVFEFRDETFTLNPSRVYTICELLRKQNIQWWCQTRGNLLSSHMVKTMKQSGCMGVSIGVESGNQHILNCMNKKVRLSEMKQTFDLLHKYGLQTYAGFMIGHPWDNLDTIVDSMWFADQINPTYIGVSVTMPFPCTLYHWYAQRYGGLQTTDYSKHHSGNVFYTPPQLIGCDMNHMKQWFERWYYSRNCNRMKVIWKRYWMQHGWKPKLNAMRIINSCLWQRLHRGVVC